MRPRRRSGACRRPWRNAGGIGAVHGRRPFVRSECCTGLRARLPKRDGIKVTRFFELMPPSSDMGDPLALAR